jgi:hypothetical protein
MTPEATTAPETTVTKVQPFPWTCPRCLQDRVFPTVIPYRAQGRRNGQLVEVDIPALKIPKCENCGELLFTESVDQQIRSALAGDKPQISEDRRKTLEPIKKLFPQALRNIDRFDNAPILGDAMSEHDGVTFEEDGERYFIPNSDIETITRRWLDHAGSFNPAYYEDIANFRFVLKVLELGSREEIN